jgi:hypothetical protein
MSGTIGLRSGIQQSLLYLTAHSHICHTSPGEPPLLRI